MRFDLNKQYASVFETRLQAPGFRVKANRWFDLTSINDEEAIVELSANGVASRLGDRKLRHQIREDPDATLIIPEYLQGIYYKSTVGLLCLQGELNPVRLETLNTDPQTRFFSVQHAVIDARIDSHDQPQVRFR